MLNLTE